MSATPAVWAPCLTRAVVWRILVGLSLVPAFGTLYQRLTLPESTRYMAARKHAAGMDVESSDEVKKAKEESEKAQPVKSMSSDGTQTASTTDTALEGKAPIAKDLAAAKKSHFREFFAYFSEWRHLKVLIGTCTCWFLLDIAYVPLLVH